MKRKRRIYFIGGIVFALALFVAASDFSDDPPNERIARLQDLSLPADGAELFAFLLREIPEVVSEVPCVCCTEVLAGCYQGACPPL